MVNALKKAKIRIAGGERLEEKLSRSNEHFYWAYLQPQASRFPNQVPKVKKQDAYYQHFISMISENIFPTARKKKDVHPVWERKEHC